MSLVRRNDIDHTVFGGAAADTSLQTAKLNAQITHANSLIFVYNESEKVKACRGAGPAKTTWSQGGPSPLRKSEDSSGGRPGRLIDRWMLRGHFTGSGWEWDIDDSGSVGPPGANLR